MGGSHHFREKFTEIGWICYLFVCLSLNGLDMFIAVNTGYYEKGVVVSKRY